MFFKKPPTPEPLPFRRYDWEKPDQADQQLSIAVVDWHFSFQPSRKHQRVGGFRFEGKGQTGPMKGVPVSGGIEVLDPGETPGMLSDHWTSVPDNVEGYSTLTGSKDWNFHPSFGVTLYCQESALDGIYRAFSTASSSRSLGLDIGLTLDCPNNQGEEFWRNQWQSEWLRVVSWTLHVGLQFRAPQ